MTETEAQWIDKFLHHLHIERRLSPHTVVGYRRDLTKLSAYMQVQRLSTWREVKIHHIRAHAAAQHRAGLNGRGL